MNNWQVNVPEIVKSIVIMLRHLKTLPQNEVHANIDAMIEALQEENWDSEFIEDSELGSEEK